MLTVADRGRGVKFAKILLTSYVNDPLMMSNYLYLFLAIILFSVILI